MTVYHGTTLSSAIQILEQGKVRAHKLLSKHKEAYASFTNDITVAHDFGRIILTFNDSIEDRLIPVREFDFKWMISNIEIMEYTVAMEQDYEDLYEEAMCHLHRKNEFFELVSKGDVAFEPHQVEVRVCGINPEQSKVAYQKLEQLFGNKYKIVFTPEITKFIKQLDEKELKKTCSDSFPEYLIMQDKDILLPEIAS